MKHLGLLYRLLTLIITIVVAFITCTKEYSYEGGQVNTSAYTIDNICTNILLNGNYYEDETLDSSHSIQLQVNVTKTGSYNIASNSANGIQFSAAGFFATIGLQTILLKANGTPTNAGVFNYTVGTNTCVVAVSVRAKRIKKASFTISGQPNQCTTAIVGGNYIAGKAMTIANTVDIQVDVVATGAYFISTDTLDGIYFSDSGNFTTTGKKLVTLKGSGVPTSPANLIFTPKADTNFCSFFLTILPPEPLATYVLESGYGTNNPCIYTLSGNYITNQTLTNTNTISMNVYVASAGNFAISTDTINGFAFGYSGVFAVAGNQKVTLFGSGTPKNTGSFSFTPKIVGPHPLGGEACGVIVNVN